jgi:hypothetical protein
MYQHLFALLVAVITVLCHPPEPLGKGATAILLYAGKLEVSLIFWGVSWLVSCLLASSLRNSLTEGPRAASPGAPLAEGGSARSSCHPKWLSPGPLARYLPLRGGRS